MESLIIENELSKAEIIKLKKYEREKRIQAFRFVFEKYKETIGDWELTDFQDAGENWRTESKLKCECGRLLRYQYTVTNRNTAEILSFGIDHLKGHTKFSDNVIREINKQLKVAEKSVNEVQQRMLENWSMNMDIPKAVVIPENIRRMLEVGLPLSLTEESQLSKLIQTAQREKWEREREVISNEQSKKISKPFSTSTQESSKTSKGNFKRIDPESGSFHLWEHEMGFVDDMLVSGVGSAMIIAEELHTSNCYFERFITGRSKLYPVVVYYLDRLVDEGKVELAQNFGLVDRVYKALVL